MYQNFLKISGFLNRPYKKKCLKFLVTNWFFLTKLKTLQKNESLVSCKKLEFFLEFGTVKASGFHLITINFDTLSLICKKC